MSFSYNDRPSTRPSTPPSPSFGFGAIGPASGHSPISPDIDPDFYFDSGLVVFQVEHCLFRVPTYLFTKESSVFAGMFRLPQPNGHDVEGSSRSNPIVMPAEFKREDFRNLLKALYPTSVSVKLTLSKAEWISVLKLSTKWYFSNLRKMAILELEAMPELTFIDKITMGREYSIASWLTRGLEGIVDRSESISDEDCIAMDYMTAVKLFRIRESKLTDRYGWGDAETAINTNFTEEIAFIHTEEEAFKPVSNTWSEWDIPASDNLKKKKKGRK